MPCSRTGATLYHAQLGLPDKDREIKEFVVCLVLPNPIPGVFGQRSKDLAPISWLNLMLKCYGQQPQPYENILIGRYYVHQLITLSMRDKNYFYADYFRFHEK